MNLYNSIIKYIIVFSLSASTLLHPQQTETKNNEQQLSTEHYVSHVITGGAVHIAFWAIMKSSIKSGSYIADILRKMVFYRKLSTKKQLQIVSTTIDISFLLGMVADLFLLYKTPQWTDKYLLKKKNKRTLKQNLIVFFNRAILPWPLGVITGEHFAH